MDPIFPQLFIILLESIHKVKGSESFNAGFLHSFLVLDGVQDFVAAFEGGFLLGEFEGVGGQVGLEGFGTLLSLIDYLHLLSLSLDILIFLSNLFFGYLFHIKAVVGVSGFYHTSVLRRPIFTFLNKTLI